MAIGPSVLTPQMTHPEIKNTTRLELIKKNINMVTLRMDCISLTFSFDNKLLVAVKTMNTYILGPLSEENSQWKIRTTGDVAASLTSWRIPSSV